MDFYKISKGDLKWENDLYPTEQGLIVYINMWLFELRLLYNV